MNQGDRKRNIQLYLQLIRVKQYIKNGLIFLAAFFAGTILEKETFFRLLTGFAAFSCFCSSVYILNDIRDVEKDRRHPVKSRRPLASGAISVKQAAVAGGMMLTAGYLLLSLTQGEWFGKAHAFVFLYLILNAGYSFGLKNVPILDIMILTSGFLIRVLYGAALCGTWVSNWLYLTVFMISLYMGTSKRKNERMAEPGWETRKVLQFYSPSFLEKIMQMSMVLAITFYSLWSSSMADRNFLASYMIWTVPLVLAIVMRYEMLVEKDVYGDPTDIILADKPIQILVGVYAVMDMGILYGKHGF